MLRILFDRLSTQRLSRSLRRTQRGMTLLEIMIVLAIIALVMGLVVGPRVMKLFGQSKVDTTRIKVTKYAYEAYPSWSSSHPDKGCPAQISDLNEYMNSDDSNDSWGHPLKMFCGQNLPPGAKGIAIMSNGEDDKEGTCDDVESWDAKHVCN